MYKHIEDNLANGIHRIIVNGIMLRLASYDIAFHQISHDETHDFIDFAEQVLAKLDRVNDCCGILEPPRHEQRGRTMFCRKGKVAGIGRLAVFHERQLPQDAHRVVGVVGIHALGEHRDLFKRDVFKRMTACHRIPTGR